jgi:hypothetical protein
VNTSSVSWAVALFFGCAILFAAVHRLTQHSSTGVVVAAQFGTLALIIVVLVVVVKAFDRKR